MVPRGLLNEHSRTVTAIVKLIDVLLLVAIGWILYRFQFGTWQLVSHYQVALLLSACAVVPVFSYFGIYQSLRGRNIIAHLRALCVAIILVMFVLLGFAFITKTSAYFSRLWFILWLIFSIIILMLMRMVMIVVLRAMRKRGWNHRKILIIGAGKLGKDLLENIQVSLWTGFDVVALLDDDIAKWGKAVSGKTVSQVPIELEEYVRAQMVDEVWLALPLRAEQRVKEILNLLRHNVITVRYFPDIFGMNLINHSVTDILGLPAVNVQSTPMVGINRLIKALEDRILSLILVCLLSPIFAVLAVLIKATSPGPVIFRQIRDGWDGKPICVYKFRTMKAQSDAEFVQATKDDQRVTTIGRWLRKTSLDELPQIINVLQGRMSLVGPRPHVIQLNEQFKDAVHLLMQRHQVKPGITGWAQVNGWRGETDTLEKMQKRIEYDLYYISHWSLWFDIKILVLTVFKGFVHKNAY